MKMSLNKLFIGTAIFSLFLTTSCQEDEFNSDKVGDIVETSTITARMETPNGTRTELGDPTDGVTPVIWTEGDVITVFSKNRTKANFTITDGSGTSVAQFSGELEGEKTFAIYPALPADDEGTGAMSVTLPTYQNYTTDNIAVKSYPTIAEIGDDGTFAFKNLCGILKLQLTGTAKVTQIVIRSNSVLSGLGTIEMSETPTLKMSPGDNKYVVLNCQTPLTGMGVQLSEGTPTNFYIVVPPTVEEDFTIEIASIDGILTKTTQKSAANVFVRSKILKMPSLAYSANIVFGGTENNTKYSPSFIAGKWWSPVNAGYQGDVTGSDHVRYSNAEFRSACPEGWELPQGDDLQALFDGAHNNNVVGFYGNSGSKGVWFGANANSATVTTPLNCIWAPYAGRSDGPVDGNFIYRSEQTPAVQLMAQDIPKIEITDWNDATQSYPVRCVVVTDNSGAIIIKEKQVVESATTTSFQAGSGEIENSFDGNMATTYHSQWITGSDTEAGITTRLPLDMVYTLEGDGGVDLDYIHYHTGVGNGTFGEVDIYFSTTTNDDAGFGEIALSHDFGKDAISEKVFFTTTQVGVKHVKFVVKTGLGNHASCLEMEFWKIVR